MTEAALLLLVPAVLAYANGANDVSKGIATLVGSGVTSYRTAIWWGTIWTGVGAAVASIAAGAMVTTFGAGLVTTDVVPSLAWAIAVPAAAATWVLIATRGGLPVSTTHALVGSFVGVTISAYGIAGVAWSVLLAKVGAPLLFSPFVALSGVIFLARGATWARRSSAATDDCVCVTAEATHELQWAGPGAATFRSYLTPRLRVTSADAATCRATLPMALRITADSLHWLSSGAASFARGLNDAPKIVGLSLAGVALSSGFIAFDRLRIFALVTAGIVIGSLAAGLRVTKVLAKDVTPMSHRDGLAANLVTALLVSVGAVNGLPMSTTHVSSGAIMGVGAQRGSLNWHTARTILGAWIVTLPAAALLGAVCYGVVRLVVTR